MNNPTHQQPQPGADVLRLIRARYIEIHEQAHWGNADECFDYDVQDMDPEMLLGLAEVYRALATWKQRYVLGTSVVTSPNPGWAGDRGYSVSPVIELEKGPKVPCLAVVDGGKQ